jgi:hypothetical protein
MNAKIATLLLAGCGPTTPPGEERVEPESVPAPAALADDPSPATALPGPPFHLVAEAVVTDDEEQRPYFRVFRAAGGELFASVGPLVIPIAADGSLELDSKWLHGMDAFRDAGAQGLFAVNTWGVVAAAGRWPDGVHLTISAEFGYRGAPYANWVYRRDEDRWVEAKDEGEWFHAFPSDLALWRGDSVLALRGFEPIHEYRGRESDETAEPTQASVRRAAAAIARQKPLVVIRGAATAPDLGRRNVAAIDALATGEIVGVVEGEKPIAVHFDPARAAVTERALIGPRARTHSRAR